MATKLVAGTSQLRLIPIDAQCSEQLRPGITRQLFQVTTKGRGALVICNISYRRSRGNHAKPRIEGSELAQKRLEGRLTQPSFLWTRRILQRLQTIQNKQGSTMGDELRESLAFLPCRSDPRILISKPRESGIKKFIRRRSLSATTLSVKGPAKDELRGAIVFRCHPSKPMVDERRLSNPSPGNDGNDIDFLLCPRTIQKSDILLPAKNFASCNGQSGYRNLVRCKSC